MYVKNITDDPQDSDVLFNISGVSECIWDPTSTYIAYLDTSDKSVLYVINAMTGEAVNTHTFPLPISMLRWSPAGNFITFVAMVYPGMSLNESAAYGNARQDEYHSTAYGYDSLPLYRWDSWSNVYLFIFLVNYSVFFLYNHLFTRDLLIMSSTSVPQAMTLRDIRSQILQLIS